MWCVSSRQWTPGPKLSWITFGMHASLQSQPLWPTTKTALCCFVPLKSCRCYHSPGCGGTKTASSVFLSSFAWPFMFGCTFTCKSVCIIDSGSQCIRFKWYLAQKNLGPIKALAKETQVKIDWTVSDKSPFERVFFKDIKVVTHGTCVVFPGCGRPWGDLTGGRMAPGLLMWWPHSPFGGKWTRLPVLCVLAHPRVPGWTESHREHGVHPRLT